MEPSLSKHQQDSQQPTANNSPAGETDSPPQTEPSTANAFEGGADSPPQTEPSTANAFEGGADSPLQTEPSTATADDGETDSPSQSESPTKARHADIDDVPSEEESIYWTVAGEGQQASESGAVDSADDLDFFSPLPTTSDFRKYEINEFGQKVQLLHQKRLLVATCQSEHILKSLTYTIAKDAVFSGYRKLLFDDMSKPRAGESPGNEQGFTDDFRKTPDFDDVLNWQRSVENQETILFVQVKDLSLADSIVKSISTQSSSFRMDHIRSSSTRVVCLIYPSYVRDFTHLQSVDEFWEIDFVFPLLCDIDDCSKEKAELLATEIHSQRKRWSPDRANFFKEVSSKIGLGREAIEQEIIRRNSTDISPLQLMPLDKMPPVQQAVYFTGAYFSGLSLNNFSSLVEQLLEDVKQASAEPAEQPDQESVKEQEDKSKSKSKKKRKKKEKDRKKRKKDKQRALDDEQRALAEPLEATEIWRKQLDKIFRECGLRIDIDGDRREFVQFKDSRMREAVKTAFRQELPFALAENFRKIILDSKLLFGVKTPPPVARQLIELTGQMALADPETYGHRLLTRIHWEIEAFERGGPELETVPIHLFSDFLSDKFRRFLEANEFYERLSAICSEFLRHDVTRDAVEKFLVALHTSRFSSKGVLRLVRRLRSIPGFDYYKWIRDIVNSSPDCREPIYSDLIRKTVQNPQKFGQVADELRTWHVSGRKLLDTPVSARYSLAFLCHYTQKWWQREVKQSRSGPGTATHPVFPSDLAQDEDAKRQRVEMLADWVCHPEFAIAVAWVEDETKGIGEDWGIGRPQLIAAMLELWTRFADDKRDQPARQSCQDLLQAVKRRVGQDRIVVRDMRRFWSGQMELFTKLMATLGPRERAQKELFRAAKKRLFKMRSEIKSEIKS